MAISHSPLDSVTICLHVGGPPRHWAMTQRFMTAPWCVIMAEKQHQSQLEIDSRVSTCVAVNINFKPLILRKPFLTRDPDRCYISKI